MRKSPSALVEGDGDAEGGGELLLLNHGQSYTRNKMGETGEKRTRREKGRRRHGGG